MGLTQRRTIQPLTELSVFYYHDHFFEMLRFVLSVYSHCLNAEEHTFLARFEALPKNAQCLFIRMVNRKAAVFSRLNLDYDEIEDIGDAIHCLKQNGFVRPASNEDFLLCLLSFSKSDLFDLATREGVPAVRLSWSKARLAEAVLTSISFERLFPDPLGFVRACHLDLVGYFLYLYFGKTHSTLLGFTLRDLRLVRVHEGSDFAARFRDEDEARHSYLYLKLLNEFRSMGPDRLTALSVEARFWPVPRSRFAQRKRDDLLLKMGQSFEKNKGFEKARELYALGRSGECRERLVRLLYGSGDIDGAAGLLDAMISDPASDHELLFATDFYGRKFQRVKLSPHTALLRSAQAITVDDSYRGSPELAVIDHFERLGWTAFHTENGLWTTLFGLLFWDQLFGIDAARTGPFDFYPAALRHHTFQDRFASEVQMILRQLNAGEGAALIRMALDRHTGKPNALFWWSDALPAFITRMMDAMPTAALATIIEKMASDFEAMSDGFPDLTLLQGKSLRFLEVKSDGDQVQRHQLTRIHQLRQAGFSVDILRVDYSVDPDQTFVVIDVETTGGRAEGDRVTEIGAVKVRGGAIVDRWQSLINPERRIPQSITAITGITNAMVADAPRFAEVAADLQIFLQGSIFVAHNVNFDYGFLSAEYRRTEQRFRYPKICTCALMRKYFPGHGSYGLAAMTREYGISLKSHHRALCDAEAAAELLLLINERRLDLERMRLRSA